MAKTQVQSKYQAFVESLSFWAEQLGLKDWDITTFLREIEEQHLAVCDTNCEARCAAVTLNSRHDLTKITDEYVEKAGCHETLHILLAPLCEIGSRRFASETETNQAEHAIIATLVSVLCGMQDRMNELEEKEEVC